MTRLWSRGAFSGAAALAGRRRFVRIDAVPLYGAALLAAAALQPARAQSVAGTVRDSLAQTPVAGAIVQLLNPRDSLLASTRSAADGSFHVGLVGAADSASHIRLLKLGYHPATVSLGAVRALGGRLTMTALSVKLSAVVSTLAECRRDDADRARAVWNEARAAWLAGMASPRSDQPTTVIREALMKGWRWPTVPPIRSSSAAASFETSRLALERFMFAHQRGRPRGDAASSADAAALGESLLRDPDFAERRCLRLERGKDEHRGELAVVFEPAHKSERAVELRGTLWVDTNAATPRALSFEYLAPTVPDRKRAGGTITFGVTPEGLPVIERWLLQLLPAHERRPERGVRIILPSTWMSDMRDTVSDTVLARWDSTTTTLGAPPRLIGRVTRLGTKEPLGGVRVSISPVTRLTPDGQVAKSRSVVTDALGRFDLEIPILTLLLRAVDTTFESVRPPAMDPAPDFDWDVATIREGEWGGPPHGAFYGQSLPFDRDQHATIGVGRNDDAFRDACGLKRRSADRWMIAGRVLPSPDDSTQSVIRARWLERSGSGAPREQIREQAADSLGYFRICKLPAGEPVQVEIKGSAQEVVVRQSHSAQIVPLILRHSGDVLETLVRN